MPMNAIHRRICSSPSWAGKVEALLPSVLDSAETGPDVLELGPGYGATTRVLTRRVERLTALEVDAASAERLAAEFGDAVRIVAGSAADMPFEDGSFSGVVCFTMLHHVPSPALQDRVFAEACRVLRPGGVFAGADSQLSLRFRLLHLGDTMVTVDPATLGDRLRAAGFADVRVEHDPKVRVRFWAAKPAQV
jgi:SAM-dependent methyltransferase